MILSQAKYIAEQLRERFAPACERVEIAGSIRRLAPAVKDIEIICIPRPSAHARPVFGQPVHYANELDALIARILSGGGDYRMEGRKDGERHKSFYLPAHGIMLDLFIVLPPAQWGVLFPIRTGPSDYSKWLVTRRRVGGALPNDCYVQNGAVWAPSPRTAGAEILPMPEETDLYNFLEIPCIEPFRRQALWNQLPRH